MLLKHVKRVSQNFHEKFITNKRDSNWWSLEKDFVKEKRIELDRVGGGIQMDS